MRRSACGRASRALLAAFLFLFALARFATAAAAASAAATTTTSSSASSSSSLAATDKDDGAAPSHSYVYERGYARFVVDKNNKKKKRNKRRGGSGGGGGGDKRLEFVRVAPSPPSSPSSPSPPPPWSPPADAVAWCEYADSSLAPSGTGHLHVATSGDFADLEQMRAAGFVEGFVTARRVADHLLNTRDYFLDPVRGLNASLDNGPLAWVAEQDRWLRAQVARKLQQQGEPSESEKGRERTEKGQQSGGELDGDDDDEDDDDGMPVEYWRAAAGTLEQLDGLAEGYRAAFEEDSSSSSSSSPSSSGADGSSRSGGEGDEGLPDLSYDDLRFLNANGELYDVLEHFKNKEEGKRGGEQQQQQQLSGTGRVRAALSSSSFAGGGGEARKAGTDAERDAERLYRALALSGRCSSLVAVTPDLSDLLIGHATWDSFSQANKIFKQFSFSLNDVASFGGNGNRKNGGGEVNQQQRLAMSSFPGELFSDDDFYLTPALAVVSTTNHILNASLFDWLPPRGRLLSWQRARVALLLARDGEAWARLFANRNSGTYNNQYNVVTLSRFAPRRELREGLLWVVEQIPGMVVAQDQTSTLERGSWPAYTVPFFPEVQRASGISSLLLVEQEGALSKEEEVDSSSPSPSPPLSPLSASKKAVQWLSYQLSPRAMLFRRGGASLTSAADLRALMRSNTYLTNDPLSGGDPVAAICGRGDLEPATAGTRQASGCFDAKVTSWARAARLDADAVAGPTTAGGTLPPFSWRDDPEFEKVPHRGLPEVFDFEYERFRPRLEARARREVSGSEGRVSSE